MTVKRNILIIVGVIVALLLIGLCTVLLFRGISKLDEKEKELARKKTEHEIFYKNNPFPSKQNAEQEKKNVEVLEEAIGKLAGRLKADEVKVVPTTPSAFMSLLGSKRRELGGMADQNGAGLPANSAFGFERYCLPDSPLPPPAELPVLSQQLTIIEQVCGILFQGKVKEITKITRDELDRPGPGVVPAGGGNRPGGAGSASSSSRNAAAKTEDKPPFTKLHFVFEFKAKERSILYVLNRIASSKIFMVVTGLKLEKEFPDILDVRAAGTAAGERPERSSGDDDDDPVAAAAHTATNALAISDRALPRDKRLMSGLKMEKPMKVTMFLEVYKFAEE